MEIDADAWGRATPDGGTREVVAMRKLVVTALTLALLGALAGPAMAAKGGGNATKTASIDLCLVDGVAVNGCATTTTLVTAAPTPHLGGTVAFAATYPRLSGGASLRTQVICRSDAGEVLWATAGAYTDTFLLGGASSDWLRNPQTATCQADLFALEWHGSNPQQVTMLASTDPFSATA
jgi:hypothetical protein